MTDKETELSEETENNNKPKFRIDFGVTLAVLAVIGLLFGIGTLSEMARNSSSSQTSSSEANGVVKGEIVESEELIEILTRSENTAKQRGIVETYDDGNGNLVGTIIFDPNANPDILVIYNAADNQYLLDSVVGTSTGLAVASLASAIDTLGDFNIISDGNNLYTIQPKEEGNNACVGLSVKDGLLETLAYIDCSTGQLAPDTLVTIFEFGINKEARDSYAIGITQGVPVPTETEQPQQ